MMVSTAYARYAARGLRKRKEAPRLSFWAVVVSAVLVVGASAAAQVAAVAQEDSAFLILFDVLYIYSIGHNYVKSYLY